MASEIEIVIDGSEGEGGGQVLRTALALSAVTGRAFSIHRLRANRIKPGLRPQHREAAIALARLCGATLVGAEVGSDRLEFRPSSPVAAGSYEFDIKKAGSTPLLFQTLCWPLALAGRPSQLTLHGRTHQQYSPTFHDLALVWAPAVARLGFRFELELQAAGFYPEGEGEMTARVEPAHAMPPLDLRHRGTLAQVEVVAMVGGLSFDVAGRLADRALRGLRDIGVAADASRVPIPARRSAGSHLLLVASFERTRAGFAALGDRGQTPETAADDAVAACASFLKGGAAVDRYRGDQLLVPAALLASGRVPFPKGVLPSTRYTVSTVTKHLLTTAAVVKRFLDVEIGVFGREEEEGEVRVQPPGGGVEVLPLGAESAARS
ncbi:MAG TPA: RNA 3'-terminal phosphate cyclase [Anaeromyxobacteraceae bacterium]|nr:RNA 3'-terminal phosphate cyclase [Anaeromyxobacteraceae bacterium]